MNRRWFLKAVAMVAGAPTTAVPQTWEHQEVSVVIARGEKAEALKEITDYAMAEYKKALDSKLYGDD